MAYQSLGLEQAADFLRMEVKELRQLAIANEIPCVRQGERLIFEQEQLDVWYSNRILHGTSHKKETRQPSNEAGELLCISDYCHLSTIEPRLTGKTKSSVLKALARLAEASGLLYNPEEFFQELRLREEEASTAMSGGVALVHPRRRDDYMFEAPFICLAKTRQGIYFGEADGRATDIFWVICCQDSMLHLQVLGRLCLLFSTSTLLEQLRQAETAAEMLLALQMEEQTGESS